MSDLSKEGIGFIPGRKVGIKTHLRNTPILGKELTRLFLAYQLHNLYNVLVARSRGEPRQEGRLVSSYLLEP